MGGNSRSGYHARFNGGIHEAEQKFEEVFEGQWARYGLANPDLRLANIPAVIRHTPDYLTNNHIIECKGIGHDQRLKVKIAEWNCWLKWNKEWPDRLLIFIWDSSKQRYTFAPLELFLILQADKAGGTNFGHFGNDGVAHWSFLVNRLGATWVTG